MSGTQETLQKFGVETAKEPVQKLPGSIDSSAPVRATIQYTRPSLTTCQVKLVSQLHFVRTGQRGGMANALVELSRDTVPIGEYKSAFMGWVQGSGQQM